MSFTPAEVNEMTYWEYVCCLSGVSKARGQADPKRGDMEVDRMRELGIEGFNGD